MKEYVANLGIIYDKVDHRQQFYTGHEKSGVAWQAYLGFMCAFLKFGAGTAVSLLLHETLLHGT